MSGFYSSRNQTANSYVLRSASKGNASKKQGVYSKFRNKSFLTKSFFTTQSLSKSPPRDQIRLERDFLEIGLRQNDTLRSRIEHHAQPSTSRARQNETVRSRIDELHNSTNRTGDPIGMSLQNGQVSTPRSNNTRQNDTTRSRIDDLHPSTKRKGDLIGTSQRNEAFTLESRDLIGMSMHNERPVTPPGLSQSRDLIGMSMRNVRPVTPPGFNQSRLKNDLMASYIRSPTKNSQASFTGVAKIGPEMSPRVVLNRIRPEIDEYGRPILRRDNDGFLVPNVPNESKFNMEDLKRKGKKALSELADALPNAEAFYVMKRFEEMIESQINKTKSKPLLNEYFNNPLLDKERKLQVIDWLQSETNSEAPLPVPTSVISAIPREILQDYAASVISAIPPFSASQQRSKETKAVYGLRDWTIIKGTSPIAVLLSGQLMDINTQALVEEDHTSSRVISADAVVVQTSCCIYQLSGEFVDPSDSIPSRIKKYFQNGKFPKEWREVIRMWSILKDEERSFSIPGLSNRTTYDEAISDVDDGRRTRPRDDDRNLLPLGESRRGLERVQSRADIRLHDIDNQRIRERDDQRMLDREGQRLLDREDQRICDRQDQRMRERGDQIIREREIQRIRDREDQRIRERSQRFREREDQTIFDREEQRVLNHRERINETPEQDDEWIRERPERLRERDENRISERVQFQDMNRLRDNNDESSRLERGGVNSSRMGRKRKGVSVMEEESVLMRGEKKRRIETTLHKRIDTPGLGNTGRTILTRSARKKIDLYVCTPKSSKRNPLKSRKKTPMPNRRGRLVYDSVASEVFNNSDLM